MANAWRLTAKYGTQAAKRPLDQAIADLADAQHGVVSMVQLVGLGLSSRAVRSRVGSARLHRIHREVFAVGRSKLPREGHWMAAVLACGEGAALSHRACAALLAIRDSAATRVEVTAPLRTGRSREGIQVHSGATLAPQDVTVVDGIPCTTVSRTLLDVATVVSFSALERAVHRAELLRIYDGRAMDELLARAGRRQGAARLKRVIADGDFTGQGTRSVLEARFFDLCSEHGIPRPDVNIKVEGSEVDFLWREQRLILETDSRAFHSHPRNVKRDLARDEIFENAGWRVRRATFNQVTYEAAVLADRLKAWLAA